MNLYERMQNITGINVEEKIKFAIQKTHEELKNFVLFCGIVSYEGEVSIKGKERMCKFYNGTLITHLKEEHVMARIVNTKDYGQTYEHVFVLIPLNGVGEGYILADLTYSQFTHKDGYLFAELLEKGYQKVSDIEFNAYLRTIENSETFFLLDDFYYSSGKKI